MLLRDALTELDAGIVRAYCEGRLSCAGSGSSRNTGERAVTPLAVGDNMYFQVGVAVRKKSGATSNPRATISVVTACRYA